MTQRSIVPVLIALCVLVGCGTGPEITWDDEREISDRIEAVETRLESESLPDNQRADLLYELGILYHRRAQIAGDAPVKRDWTEPGCFLAPELTEFTPGELMWAEQGKMSRAIHLRSNEPSKLEPVLSFDPAGFVEHNIVFPEAHCAASRWNRELPEAASDDYSSAVRHFDELRRSHPDYEQIADAVFFAGEALAIHGLKVLAFHYWMMAVEEYENTRYRESSVLYMGEYRLREYYLTPAREYFEQIADGDTEAAFYAQYMLGWTEVVEGRYEAARYWFDELLRPSVQGGASEAGVRNAAVTGLAATYAAEGIRIDDAREFISPRVEEPRRIREFLRSLIDYCGDKGEPSFSCRERTKEIEFELAKAYQNDGLVTEAIKLAEDLCDRGFKQGCEFVE